MNKRTKNFIFFIAAILLGLWLGRVLRPDGSQLRGELTFDRSAIPNAAYTTGNFIIRWDERTARLYIEHDARPGFALWETLPGESFIQAAQGQETITQNNGMFEVHDSWSDTCVQQEITSLMPTIDGPTGIELRGRLYCQSGEIVAYSLLIYTYKDEPDRLVLILAVEANRAFLTYASNIDEHFFGFGVQYSFVDLKGKRVPIWVNEQGVGRGDQPATLSTTLGGLEPGNKFSTEAPVPFYMTSQLRSLLLLNSGYSLIDLRAEDRVQVQAFGKVLIANLFSGASPAEILAQVTQATGRVGSPPEWVYRGAIVGTQGGTQRVQELQEALHSHGAVVAAYWLEDWTGMRDTSAGARLWWNWEVDRDLYPGWEGLVQELNQAGTRVMVTINPTLEDVSEKTNFQQNLFQEAAAQGFLVKTGDGNVYPFETDSSAYGMVDLTNEEALDWFSAVIEEQVIQAGVSGWMADLGSGLPTDAVLDQPNDENTASLHNRWPGMWAGLNQDIQDNSGQELAIFTNAGFTGSQSTTSLFRLGEQNISWGRNDGIKSAISALNSGGISGFAFSHSEIGGSTNFSGPLVHFQRSDELLSRWMEMNAFTMIFRTGVGQQPEENIQIDTNSETLDGFAYWSKVYAALFDFRKALVAEAVGSGLPVVRHPFLHYPDDPDVWKITFEEFMLGSDFLVAPVTDPGVETVRVYLPAGDWVHVWSGEVFRGSQYVSVNAPIGQPAVFYVLGSPWGESFRHTLESEGLLP